MRLAVSAFGIEWFAIEITDDAGDGPGDCTSTPVGFVRDEAGHEWQRGVER